MLFQYLLAHRSCGKWRVMGILYFILIKAMVELTSRATQIHLFAQWVKVDWNRSPCRLYRYFSLWGLLKIITEHGTEWRSDTHTHTHTQSHSLTHTHTHTHMYAHMHTLVVVAFFVFWIIHKVDLDFYLAETERAPLSQYWWLSISQWTDFTSSLLVIFSDVCRSVSYAYNPCHL